MNTTGEAAALLDFLQPVMLALIGSGTRRTSMSALESGLKSV